MIKPVQYTYCMPIQGVNEYILQTDVSGRRAIVDEILLINHGRKCHLTALWALKVQETPPPAPPPPEGGSPACYWEAHCFSYSTGDLNFVLFIIAECFASLQK